MTIAGGVNQGLSGKTLPVLAVDPPPEGRQVVPLTFALTPTNYSISPSVNLSSYGSLSQIVSIYVDNSQNEFPLTVVHGIALQSFIVPAGGGAIIPTTSNGPNYFLNLATAEAPSNNVNVNVTLYNYSVSPTVFGDTVITETTTISADVLPNPFVNAGCNVAQRGASGNDSSLGAAPKVCLDQTYLQSTGANVSWSQAAGIGQSSNSLLLTGVTANTDIRVIKRVISADAAPFGMFQCTLQFKVLNLTGAAITPSVIIKHPTTQDVFSSVNIDSTLGVQTCPQGSTTQCAVSFAMPQTVTNGLQIEIDLGALASNTQQIYISDFDLAVTPGVASGLVQTPSVPRLRSLSDELTRCQFFFDTTRIGGVFSRNSTLGGYTYSGGTGAYSQPVDVRFSRPMWKTPTFAYYDGAGTANKGSENQNGAWSDGYAVTLLALTFRDAKFNETGGQTGIFINYDASAEP